MTATFRWRAATEAGEVVEGRLAAPSVASALDALRRQRLVPVSVEPDRAAAGVARLARGMAVTAWVRAVATLAGAGVPLERALAFAAAQAGHPVVAADAEAIRAAVAEGAPLSVAMRAASASFAPLDVALVAAGEAGGTLADALARLADQRETRDALGAQLREALRYPALMAGVTTLGLVVLLVVVIPRFVAMLGDVGATPPWSTRLLLGVSGVAARGWWVALLALGASVAAARAWLADGANRRAFHARRREWPLWGPVEVAADCGRWLATMGSLLQAGVGVPGALALAEGVVGNQAWRAALARASREVDEGRRLSEALAGVLPPLATQLVAAGEESGRLAELCIRGAAAYDAEARRRVRGLIGLLEPVLVIGFGAVVGFVALAMLQAIYGVNAGALGR